MQVKYPKDRFHTAFTQTEHKIRKDSPHIIQALHQVVTYFHFSIFGQPRFSLPYRHPSGYPYTNSQICHPGSAVFLIIQNEGIQTWMPYISHCCNNGPEFPEDILGRHLDFPAVPVSNIDNYNSHEGESCYYHISILPLGEGQYLEV